jgi:hypothetical protein
MLHLGIEEEDEKLVADKDVETDWKHWLAGGALRVQGAEPCL